MFLDVMVSGKHDYTMALYFLDWDLRTGESITVGDFGVLW
jgi:hypothetical protein